jgi:hypothetical protein
VSVTWMLDQTTHSPASRLLQMGFHPNNGGVPGRDSAWLPQCPPVCLAAVVAAACSDQIRRLAQTPDAARNL